MAALAVVVVACLGSLSSCGRPSCQQPLAAYCADHACLTWAEALQQAVPSDGGCVGSSISDCGDWRVRSWGKVEATAEYYDADGGLVAVAQASDVGWECGANARTFGDVPACTGSVRKTYCVR